MSTTKRADPKPGTRLGRYTLVEPLGSGATAVVWLARETTGRKVAIKVRRRGAPSLDRRFLREFESLRALRVPGVVRVYEAGLAPGLLWFSMEWVDGIDFQSAVQQEPAPEQRMVRAVQLGRQLFDALAALHQAGLVHRDIKPHNVLVDNEDRVHVLDFGVIRWFGGESTVTDVGEVMGTVPYMSPEQVSGLPFDHRVDLWAAGVMLYEALGGEREQPQTMVGWISQICTEEPRPLALTHREVPLALSDVVHRLLAVVPHLRPEAVEVARVLRRIAQGERAATWPEPPFLDPPLDNWTAIEGCLGGEAGAPVQILSGPSGSGKRRLAEYVHRQALLQGFWPLHATSQRDAVGAPVEQWLQHALGRAQIDAHQGGILRWMWPRLPLGRVQEGLPVPTARQLSETVVKVLLSASQRTPLVLILHRLEDIDRVTARVLLDLAEIAGSQLGLLLLHETRWSSGLTDRLLGLLAKTWAQHHHLDPWPVEACQELARSLCPDGSDAGGIQGAVRPQHAVEHGLALLGRWRGEPWEQPDAGLWPIAVWEQQLPEAVLGALAGRGALSTPHVRRREYGVELAGEAFARSVSSRIGDRVRAARALSRVWAEVEGDRFPAPAEATLALLADDRNGAWKPAARAALACERTGRFTEARRWLLVLDALPASSAVAELAFPLALCRARVALATEPGKPRMELAELCARIAGTPAEHGHARLILARYRIRLGEARSALVECMRLASPAAQPQPAIAARAQLIAAEIRQGMGQLEEAGAHLDRAAAWGEKVDDRDLAVELDNARAVWLLARHDLPRAQKAAQKALRRSAEAGSIRGAALAAARLGQVLRMQGRRREAEHQVRAALSAFSSTGDLEVGVWTHISLATLLIERGDVTGARSLLDTAMTSIRDLHLHALQPAAMRVLLQVATHLGDTTEAQNALDALSGLGERDDELPAARVRWWRSRRDLDRALAIEPPQGQYGRTLWRIERARAALSADPLLARREARAALDAAEEAGHKELCIYAEVFIGALDPEAFDRPTWSRIHERAQRSLNAEVFLGAVELDARRQYALGDMKGALETFRVLRARAEELGYRPAIDEADGWLA